MRLRRFVLAHNCLIERNRKNALISKRFYLWYNKRIKTVEVLFMNKVELIRAIANNAGLTLKDAGNALDGFIAAITEGLKNGEKIQISGFGSFEIKDKAAREGVNPKTGKKINIAASKVPAFKFGKAYKDQF